MAQRRAANPYCSPRPLSGCDGVPPMTQKFPRLARETSAEVSVKVVAPATCWPVGLPLLSSSGTDACVVT